MQTLTPLEKPIKIKTGVSRSKILTFIFILLFLAISGSLFYLYQENQSLKKVQAQNIQNQKSNSELKDLLAKHMLLPDEEPTIATVNDINLLREQNPEFYKNGENGDILFIYKQKAILYDSNKDLILNVAPIVDVHFTTPTLTNTPKPTTKNSR